MVVQKNHTTGHIDVFHEKYGPKGGKIIFCFYATTPGGPPPVAKDAWYQLKTGCVPYFSTMLTDCFSTINDGYRPINDYIHHLLGLLLPTDNIVCMTYAFHPVILKQFE